jgi:hypothetical protein
MTGLINTLIPTMNYMANGAEFVMERGGKVLVPTALGAIGGYLVGIGPQIGAFQGLTSGALYSWVLRPISQFISNHEGERPEQIHKNTKVFLYTAGTATEVALPLFLTKTIGTSILTVLASLSPKAIQWLIIPSTTKEYTIWKGILVTIAPAIAQHLIETLRKEDKKQKRS